MNHNEGETRTKYYEYALWVFSCSIYNISLSLTKYTRYDYY